MYSYNQRIRGISIYVNYDKLNDLQTNFDNQHIIHWNCQMVLNKVDNTHYKLSYSFRYSRSMDRGSNHHCYSKYMEDNILYMYNSHYKRSNSNLDNYDRYVKVGQLWKIHMLHHNIEHIKYYHFRVYTFAYTIAVF